jgi:hypothetical protein
LLTALFIVHALSFKKIFFLKDKAVFLKGQGADIQFLFISGMSAALPWPVYQTTSVRGGLGANFDTDEPHF